MTTDGCLKVKLLFNTGHFQRYLPRNETLDGVSFSLDRDEREYDWLVIYSDFIEKNTRFMPASETLGCHPDNTLLVTHEPSSIKRYNSAFVNQFNWVLSCHDSAYLKHPNLIPSHPASSWFWDASLEELLSMPLPKKQEMLSTVCSDKSMDHTLHKDRLEFTRRLAREIPEMTVYGKIGKPLADKRAALEPFRLHLAIENHVGQNHWTEKLADAFLGYCLPLYCGCTNIFDFFPEGSIIPLDIFKFGESAERIRKAISDNEYEQCLPLVREARRKLMEEHSLFSVIAKFVKERHAPKKMPAAAKKIWNHSATVRLNPIEGMSHVIKKHLQQSRHFADLLEKRSNSDLYG